MKLHAIQLVPLLAMLLSSCVAPQAVPTEAPSPQPTEFPPSATPEPTRTPIPSATAPPATSTPTPQPLLLRRSCGRDYVVRADEPIQIYYGGWGVKGFDLAQQWSTALTVDLTIDGSLLQGTQQPPARDLPYNCPKVLEDVYWLYYSLIVPGLAPGTHDVAVAFNSLRPLPDGYGATYGTGLLAEQTFTILAE